MKLNDYFEREDTPSQNSPVGQVMLKLCEKRPEMSYEEMRESKGIWKQIIQNASRAKRNRGTNRT